MDGKVRYLDTIFSAPLWRSRKDECVYLHAWETGSQTSAGVGRWITFDTHQRPHAAHRGHPPAVGGVKTIETDQQVQTLAQITRKTLQGSGSCSHGCPTRCGDDRRILGMSILGIFLTRA